MRQMVATNSVERERLLKLMHDVCPFRIGSRVKMAPGREYSSEWPDTYIVVMIAWDYQHGDHHGINIAIAGEDEIINRQGWTDGWSPNDLLPA